MNIIKHAALALAMTLSIAGVAHAGQSCEERPMTQASFTQAMSAARALSARLDGLGSDVALVGRQGQDLGKYGLKYSHVGLAMREGPGHPWRVVELLNRCGTANSDLWVDGLANFFMDDPFTYDSVAMIPPEGLRARLASELRAPAILRSFHQTRYNMVAYPFSTKYQNSNQWVLEVIAAAEAAGEGEAVATREQAQAWLSSAGYKPTEMKIGALTRLGGRMFKTNIAFDDHPNELRFSDRINTVTVDSMIAFLKNRGEGWVVEEIAGPAALR